MRGKTAKRLRKILEKINPEFKPTMEQLKREWQIGILKKQIIKASKDTQNK